MPETPEQIFARLMPGYDLAKARRTKEGFPYVYEEAEFEPGTYGQRSAGKPLVRVSPKAKPWELEHELEHVRQLYRGDNLDEGYDEERQARMYQSYGLTPDEAYGLAYGMRPSTSHFSQMAKPRPSSPRRSSSGTSTFSKWIS